jgi:hypothetical protein
VTDTGQALETLSAAELDAVALLWKRERRRLTTSFSGTSMFPAIAPGQTVLVECGLDPAVGDVVVFRFANQLGVHRVAARNASWILPWGDANPLPDEPIEPTHAIGAIRGVRVGRVSARRRLLLQMLAPSSASLSVVTRRVRTAYRVRTLWGKGPLAFAAAAVRALLRRLTPSFGRPP